MAMKLFAWEWEFVLARIATRYLASHNIYAPWNIQTAFFQELHKNDQLFHEIVDSYLPEALDYLEEVERQLK